MTPRTTFYTCIESGRLEPEVLLMVRTLRAFGGRFSNCQVLAIKSRAGPALASSTRKQLDALQVTYLDQPQRHSLDWLGFTCKPLAAEIADAAAKTPYVAWLDGDIFVVKEPKALEADGPEVLACTEELGPVSAGPGDRFDPFWAALARVAGLQEMPMVAAGPTGKRLRLHFNSGVFRFRRGSGFTARYREVFDRFLALRTVPKDDPSIFLHEQIAFSAAAASWPGGFAALAPDYNFHAEPMYEAIYPPQDYGRAVLLHWHGSLRMPEFVGTFVERLDRAAPELSRLVRQQLPLTAPRALGARLERALRRRWRLRLEARYMSGIARV